MGSTPVPSVTDDRDDIVRYPHHLSPTLLSSATATTTTATTAPFPFVPSPPTTPVDPTLPPSNTAIGDVAACAGGPSAVFRASASGTTTTGTSTGPQRASFRVKFSALTLAFPEGAQRHPATVSFNFDSFWAAESTPTSAPNNAVHTHHPLQFATTSTHSSKPKPLTPPENDQTFIYETNLASKLHRKFLVLTLNLPAGMPSPTAVISLDAIARGCQRIALSFPDPFNPAGPVAATASFRVAMLNFDRVQAQLSEIRVVDYPEMYMHDVKILYVELGYKPFVEGYTIRSEQSSDGEPLFSKIPQLERVCSLQEMLHGGATPTDLRIFFSLHRQVARTRSEEIGLGALPVHMLFRKVVNGVMDIPTKFKVPLAGYKGLVKGKILLRNIPQWSQLGGDDLINRDGTITPTSVDLNSRKLLPWIKLPKSLIPQTPTPSPPVRPYEPPVVPPFHPGPGSFSELDAEPTSFGRVNPPSAKWLEQNPSSLALSTSEVGANSMGGLSIAAVTSGMGALSMYGTYQPPVLAGQGHSRHSSGEYYADLGSSLYAVDGYSGHAPPVVPAGLSAPTSPYHHEPYSDKEALDRELQLQNIYRAQNEDLSSQPYSMSNFPSGPYFAEPDNAAPSGDAPSLASGGWSAKSVGSSTTGHDGASQNQSNTGSDDGVAPRSSGAVNSVAVPGAAALPSHGDWIAIRDTSSDRYYFANRVTNESLWLPPLWDVLLDSDGALFFVDHGSKTTQREFPAEEARAYKNSVYG